MKPIKKTFQYGDSTVTLETGRLARQATGAVFVTMDNVQVLCTVVAATSVKEDIDFFPLSVHYQEKTYAVGKIPGNFFKREGRPSEKEILTSRLIDRPIRPLFPNGFKNEVQVICTVMSADNETSPDIAAMIGTSAALAISGVPFNGPIGGARVGFTPEQGYLLNPTYSQLAQSQLDMVVAGTSAAVLMVESGAQELTEDQMLGAVLFGHQEMQTVIKVIDELVQEVGKPRWEWQPAEENIALLTAVVEGFTHAVGEAYHIADKTERYARINELKEQAVVQLTADDETQYDAEDIKRVFGELEKNLVRQRILNGDPRIDGRDTKTVRPIAAETALLKKAHGSALFTRGETQAIGVTTLSSLRDAQLVDALEGKSDNHFMLHYNFDPYAVNECGRATFVNRRMVGHGALARRALLPMLPNQETFPFTIRTVSETTESNGSSSMAAVCVASMSMMDAGVPVQNPVAGVAMGLVKEGERFAILTDILGDEDHLGDMDFKVAGTANGVTALQMDIKIEGINEQIMEIALEQALQARLHILGQMQQAIQAPRENVSENAPAIATFKIDAGKIRDVIGKGGATIRAITEETGAQVDLDDDGTVRIYGENATSRDTAIDKINAIIAEAEIGGIYTGKVTRIADFGAFVSILPGKDGLVHISQITEERVEKVADHLEEGQEVTVKVLDVDQRGRIKLSMKDASADNRDADSNATAAL